MPTPAVSENTTNQNTTHRRGRGRGGRPQGDRSQGDKPAKQRQRPRPKSDKQKSDKQKSAPKPTEVKEKAKEPVEDEDAELCFICTEPIVTYAVSACDHRTCHLCALRLRSLYRTRNCAYCKVKRERCRLVNSKWYVLD